MSASREGFIHELACIGSPPQDRRWREGDVLHPPEIDATAQVGAFALIDSGYARPTKVGPRAWIMGLAHVGHDVEVCADAEICPTVCLGGYCEIGEGAFVGMGAVIRPRLKIGAGAKIGMCAVVTRDVPPGEVWAGNPARPLRKEGRERFRTDDELFGEWWDSRGARAA